MYFGGCILPGLGKLVEITLPFSCNWDSIPLLVCVICVVCVMCLCCMYHMCVMRMVCCYVCHNCYVTARVCHMCVICVPYVCYVIMYVIDMFGACVTCMFNFIWQAYRSAKFKFFGKIHMFVFVVCKNIRNNFLHSFQTRQKYELFVD